MKGRFHEHRTPGHFRDERDVIEQVVARRFLALGVATMAAAEGPTERGEAAEALRA